MHPKITVLIPAPRLALDPDLPIAIANGKLVYHVPEPLIGNRYYALYASRTRLNKN